MTLAMLRRTAGGLATVLALAAPPLAGQRGPADLVLRHGKVVTVDDKLPMAQAVAVKDGRILAVGSDAEIGKLIGGATRVIELNGRLAVPGLIEGHGHYLGLGAAKMQLDLTKARNFDDIVAMVGEAAKKAKPGEWITGRGWHQEKWDRVPQPNVEGVPLHAALDAVSPDNPVVLTHASGHAGFANGKALALAGITRETPAPPGGDIVKDAAGEPTGLLRETAQRLVGQALGRSRAGRPAAEAEAEMRKQVELAGHEALSKGITTFHDAGSSFATIDLFRKMADEGKLPVRLYVMARNQTNEEYDRLLPKYRMIGYGRGFLTVRSIKHAIDGALGPHGAWLLEPYTDMPSSTGNNTTDLDVIRRTAEIALKYDFQLNTHAIGDRGNREILDIYEAAFRAHPEKKDTRWRIEHAQHVSPQDVPRFKQLGIIASMQGIHATSDGPYVPKRLGDKRAKEESYLWRTFLDEGVVVTNGTDTPVEDVDPLASFYASVTRRMKNGEYFYPEQRMTREEALRSYTLSNAYAAFEENVKGSLT
ncbi:MAG TPA: amidohydrolase, partial [Longimicrobiales bacterium]|nr:amidohydrolase [Longimicrobiales bacterium]